MTDPTAPTGQTDAENAAAGLKAVAESTATVLRVVADLAPEAVTEPSALPGWTRGHVLAHLARNADSLVNLLDSARTGEDIPQYASSEARDRGIEDGAPRPLAEQLADLRATHERFAAAAAELPDEAWSAQLRHRSGYVFPAHELPRKRLLELEYHLVDLGAGYTPADWPLDFAATELPRLADHFTDADGLPTLHLAATDTDHRATLGTGRTELTVEGPLRTLVAWLSGRSDGTGLSAPTALPTLPPMG